MQYVQPADIASVAYFGFTRSTVSAKPLVAYDLDVLLARGRSALKQDCRCTAISEDSVRTTLADVDDEAMIPRRTGGPYFRIAVIRFRHRMSLPMSTGAAEEGKIVSLVLTTPPARSDIPLETTVWVGTEPRPGAAPKYAPLTVLGDPLHMNGPEAAIPMHWFWYRM